MRVSFQNKKGQRLAGILESPKKKTDNIVIFLHGLKGDKTAQPFMNLLSSYLIKQGIASLRFDFNSHGESFDDWKNFTRKSTSEDFDAAYNFVLRRGYQHVGVFGTSLGTTSFALRPKGITASVLHAPFILSEMYREWILPFADENKRAGYVATKDSEGIIRKFGLSLQEESLKGYGFPEISVPTLLLIGEKDKYITRKCIIKTEKKFIGPKKTIIIKGAGHSETMPEQDEEIAKQSLKWYKKYL